MADHMMRVNNKDTQLQVAATAPSGSPEVVGQQPQGATRFSTGFLDETVDNPVDCAQVGLHTISCCNGGFQSIETIVDRIVDRAVDNLLKASRV